MMNLDGSFTYVSPSVRALRGYTPEEVMQIPFSAALTPESAASVAAGSEGLRARIAAGLPVEGHFELEQPCKDGTTVWTDTVISTMVDDEGRILGLLGVSRNITARKRAERERLALEAQLRQSQKLESIGTLASGVAHEINNPLTGVINYADLIGRRTEDPQLREFAREIVSEGNRMAEIVRGLLSFARQETSKRTREQMPDILHASLTLVGSLLKRDQIRLEQRIAKVLPAVRCNAQQIEQVVINLLTNARDALNGKYPSHHEGKAIVITVRPLEKDGLAWVRTTVEDHGAGVPIDLMTRIFDPFFTTKPRDMGTGLGLSISYGIAKEHGGSLTVESEEGSTTRFHLDLPAEPDEPSPAA
jgi:PAS domain S-box-containing protein